MLQPPIQPQLVGVHGQQHAADQHVCRPGDEREHQHQRAGWTAGARRLVQTGCTG